MSNTDPIADMLTIIRNGVIATHESVQMPSSKLKVSLANLLKKEGYISSFEVVETAPSKKTLKISLKYGPRGEKLITGIKRVSKPGLKVYTTAKESPRVFDGLGISVLSTNKGLMTDRQARKEKVGGELLCQVW